MKQIPDWVILDSSTGDAVCEWCKEREQIPLPMRITSFEKWCIYFGDRHKYCKEKHESGTVVE